MKFIFFIIAVFLIMVLLTGGEAFAYTVSTPITITEECKGEECEEIEEWETYEVESPVEVAQGPEVTISPEVRGTPVTSPENSVGVRNAISHNTRTKGSARSTPLHRPRHHRKNPKPARHRNQVKHA